MTKAESELKKRRIRDFRYSVVAELANPYLSKREMTELLKEKAKREYVIPYSKRTRITESCIKNWLRIYRQYGQEGLTPATRSDKGQSRIIKDKDQSAIIHLLETNPELTATAAVKKLQKKGIIENEISSSSLSHFIQSNGLSYKERNERKANEKCLKFDFFYPLECVQVDVMYGPEIPNEKGKHKKALLMAFLDDTTRRIIYSKFSFSEKSLLFEDGIKHILKTHGMLGRLYTDNGSTFISKQTQRILDSLGIILSHSRPGIPKGRGKVERFFRTVRDQFTRPLDVEEVKNIEDLNARFHTWLECEYHRTPHRSLKEHITPLDEWIAKAHHIKPFKAGVDIDKIFLHMLSRKVYKDSTFTLNGILFEAPAILANKRINIYFDPHPPINRVFVRYEGKDYGDARLVDSYANTKVKRNYTNTKDAEIDNNNQIPANLFITDIGGK